MKAPPENLNGGTVLEFAFFDQPRLPHGYIPPQDRAPLAPVQNLAICRQHGVSGYYLYYCDASWNYVTYSFYETLEAIKLGPQVEFDVSQLIWYPA